jgi:hypothetical protein
VQAWVNVLSFVDTETIVGSVGLVSHAFHALAAEPQLWRRLLLRHFPSSSSAATDATSGGDEAVNLYEGEGDGWRKSYFAHRWLARSVRTRTPVCLPQRAHPHA